VTGKPALPVQRGPLDDDPWATGPSSLPLPTATSGRNP
jgi:hypothetical protein